MSAIHEMPTAEVLQRAEAFGPQDSEIRLHIRAADGPEATASFKDADVEMSRWALAEIQRLRKFDHHRAIMRLALQMIVAQCKCFTEGRAYIVDPIRRTAEQALRECGK